MSGYRKATKQDARQEYTHALRTNANTINLYVVDRNEDIFREGLLKKLNLPPKAAGSFRREEPIPDFDTWMKGELERVGFEQVDFYRFSARAW